MFGRGAIELNPRKFWSWFASESQGIANALEALQRGEADAEWAIIGLNERIRRFEKLYATIAATDIDWWTRQYLLALSGENPAAETLAVGGARKESRSGRPPSRG